MKVVGHKTEAIYRRYAIVDEVMMREASEKPAAFHEREKLPVPKKVQQGGEK